MKKHIIVYLLFLMGVTSTAFANELVSKSPADATVYIIEPVDGQTVSQRFKVKFGLSGMGVAPAGTNQENTGHHHILIDREDLPEYD